jgi:hypothetical protein
MSGVAIGDATPAVLMVCLVFFFPKGYTASTVTLFVNRPV